MKKTVYIETTIPSYLTAKPSHDIILLSRQESTKEWWEKYRYDYSLFTSDIVFEEAQRGDPGYAELRMQVLNDIPVLDNREDIEELANKYLKHFNFAQTALRDAFHIAFAVIYKLDFLLTWNCTHLANAEMRKEISRFNIKLGYETPDLCTPIELIPPDVHIEEE